MIVDYKGAIVGKQRDTNGSTFVTGVINIEALRHHRANAQVTNWLKDIRAEMAQLIYEKPIYPKNRYWKQMPPNTPNITGSYRPPDCADAGTRHLEEAGALRPASCPLP